jgi:Stress responsive A/B Barrel Domain
MRKFVVTALLAMAIGCWLSPLGGNARDAAQPPKSGQPPYVHTVVFYLKKDTPPAKVEAMIADCHSVLGKIPTVRSLWVGRPAAKGSPELAIKDYNVALVILFDNYEGLKTYIDHPNHVKLVETYSPSFEKVLVYDFENQAK